MNCVGTTRHLSVNEKKIRKMIIEEVFKLWPSHLVDKKKAASQIYSLLDPCAFWHKILKQVFTVKATSWINESEGLVC